MTTATPGVLLTRPSTSVPNVSLLTLETVISTWPVAAKKLFCSALSIAGRTPFSPNTSMIERLMARIVRTVRSLRPHR